MVYIFAANVAKAKAWADENRIPPGGCRVHGNWSKSTVGQQYRSGDRLVIVGAISQRVESAIRINARKSPGAPPIEREP